MKSNSIKVIAPATVSNVGPGFDIMGFAINTPVEEMTVRISDKPGIRILKISGDKSGLPFDIKKNTAAVAVTKMLASLKLKIGVEIEIRKMIISGSGLGSSAASAVAAPVALNELLDRPFTKQELMEFALEGEKVASGSIHADNVAPCLFGGFILIRGYKPMDIIPLSYPKKLFCTVLHPQFAIKTSDARKLIRKNYPLKEVVAQAGNAGGLIAGLLKSDYDLIRRSMNDLIAEPARAKLIPGFYKIKEAALNAGAVGCSISGSGPAVFAFCTSENDAEKIGRVMKKISSEFVKKNMIYISNINSTGPRVIG
ncbi:MAG: homoserine kinase [Ignavibacteriae bacterium HGW-Ignavibacteriae-3]|nr:MAG: homoserine kinase [Ignavibacteriae bacterium HGW-Ignavibacteriae-3]